MKAAQPTLSPLGIHGVVLTTLLLLGSPSLFAAEPDAAVLERGRYLVEQVAMCGDCHSPRDEKGQLMPELHLHGAALGFAPKVPMPVWASVAPNIAGLPTLRADKAEQVLSTGEGRPTGPLRPPMPEYRFSSEDAKAVVVYLKSLKGKKH